MSGKPLSRGSPLSGSPDSKIIVGLVIVAVVLATVCFALFAANQSEDKTLKDTQALLDDESGNASQISNEYAALSANYSHLNDQYQAIKAEDESITQQYNQLQNNATSVNTQLSGFLENQPTIAYTYTITQKLLPNNLTDQVITVTAYNLGRSVAANVKINCTVMAGNMTTDNNQTIAYIQSMGKRQASWEFSNATQIVNVWAGMV